jgi:hypothetical protein
MSPIAYFAENCDFQSGRHKSFDAVVSTAGAILHVIFVLQNCHSYERDSDVACHVI